MFVINKEYDRQELLDFVGSKQIQSGIIWGSKEEGCVIITSGGKHGISAGYGDAKNEDGSWYYFGQGSKGDQDETSKANSLLIDNKRNILLFSTREPSSQERKEKGNSRKVYKFEGIFDVLSYRYQKPAYGSRKDDNLLEFHLIPVSNMYDNEDTPVDIESGYEDLNELRKKILTEVSGKLGERTPQQYRYRSMLVKNYALLRAEGVCELCNKKAPFITHKNIPFLEVHHIFKLADDGPDLPHNVSAICPNCHREAHFGNERNNIKDRLENIIAQKEMV